MPATDLRRPSCNPGTGATIRLSLTRGSAWPRRTEGAPMLDQTLCSAKHISGTEAMAFKAPRQHEDRPGGRPTYSLNSHHLHAGLHILRRSLRNVLTCHLTNPTHYAYGAASRDWSGGTGSGTGGSCLESGRDGPSYPFGRAREVIHICNSSFRHLFLRFGGLELRTPRGVRYLGRP
jgi:hypothetical protein